MEDQATAPSQHNRALPVDESAYGVIYGTITVLSLLMATHQPIQDPFRTALVLFAAVVAVALAKAYAEVCDRMLANERPATVEDIRSAWRHSRTVLLAANAPTASFLLAGLNLIPVETAFLAAQVAAIAGVVYFGGRIGWKVRKTALSTILGAGVTGTIGLLISLMKYLAH